MAPMTLEEARRDVITAVLRYVAHTWACDDSKADNVFHADYLADELDRKFADYVEVASHGE